MPERGSPSARAQAQMGLPPNFKTYSPFPFAGMNVQASAPAIADTEFLWQENFLRIGDGNLRTAWDVGSAIYTAPAGKTIVWHYFYTIGASYYGAIFLSDGSATQINTQTLATAQIGASGFYSSSASTQLPGATQWGTQFLLICNRNTANDYWVWDGSKLYTAGTAAPTQLSNPTFLSGGANYNSAPTVTPFGGSGSGMVVAATVQGGSIVALRITNPGTGYQPGDVVQLAFSGGGSDTSAQLTASLTTPGSVGAVNVSAGGTGYSSSFAVSFSGGGGTGAAGTATASSGVVTGVTVTSAGSGYTSAPSISFTAGGGTGATGSVLLAPSGVGSVTVVNGGSGFTSVPDLNFVGGGGAGAVAVVVLSPTSIARVNITANGNGYSSAPTVAFVGGGGSGAAGTAVLGTQGEVISVTLTNAGSGYTSQPDVTFTGGSGTGATATPVLAGTSIASVQMSNSGSLYTSAPAVEVSPGSNNAAEAVVELMPFGVSGSLIETFGSRVWVGNPMLPAYAIEPPGGNFSYTTADSLTDFATSDGGGNFINSDRFLQTQYVQVRQSNGYLYFFGDGSVSVVSNVQTSGSPATTVFSYQNVDPQSGAAWRDSMQDFGRSIIFGNPTGIYGMYGGNVAKISGKLDQLFTKGVFPPSAGAIQPSSTTATLFNVKHYLCLMTVVDPDTSALRNVMVTWNEKDWCITSQSTNLTYVSTQKINSKFYAWGTDGNSLFPLFAKPSTSLVKRLDTKLYGMDSPYLSKDLMVAYLIAQDQSAALVGINASLSFAVSGVAVQALRYPSDPSGVFPNAQTPDGVLLQQASFAAPPPAWPVWGTGTGGLPFMMIGARLTTTSPDFILANLVLGYVPTTALF